MKKIDQSLVNLAISFLENHWDEIDLKGTEIEQSKMDFIKKVAKSPYLTSWVISEVMSWGCNEDYLKKYEIDYPDFFVIQVDNKFFKMNSEYIFERIEPKTRVKTEIYFE